MSPRSIGSLLGFYYYRLNECEHENEVEWLLEEILWQPETG
jgi:hypothetical protein